MKPILIRRVVDVSVPRDRLWTLLRDTDRLNRAQGLPPVEYRTEPGTDGAPQVEAEARVGPLRLRWTEQPFEWVEGQRHLVTRIFRNGPLRRFRGGVELADGKPGATRVTIRAELHPRGPLGWLAARWTGNRLIDDLARLLRVAEAQFIAERPVVLPGEAPRDPGVIRRRIARVLARPGADVAQEPRQLCAALQEWVATAADHDVSRIRPFALAREWKCRPMELLRLCLRATRAGLLEMSWEVICPSCRGGQKIESLADIPPEAHCETCRMRFDVNFDEALEVTFRPHPQIRQVDNARFCAFGPGNTPHVFAQLRVPAQASIEETIAFPQGRFRIQSPQSGSAAWLDVGRAEAAASQPESETGEVIIRPDAIESRAHGLRPGEPARLTVRNELPGEARVLIERPEWAQDAATAAVVSSIQEFRDLFATEALARDMQLKVASLTFLFTDLKGSTALYSTLGDARAYALVREHFEFLMDSVRRFDGAIVKTIGDSVMAVFHDPASAVACCLDVQHRVQEFNAAHPPGAIVLKMGVHGGPCLAVRLNERLDYFGTTVNVASRLEHLSQGGDMVISETVAADAMVKNLLGAARGEIEQFQCPLKGLDNEFCLLRFRASLATTADAASD